MKTDRLDEQVKANFDLLSSQPVDQRFGVGHFVSTGLGVILQVLLLLHGRVIEHLQVRGGHVFRHVN